MRQNNFCWSLQASALRIKSESPQIPLWRLTTENVLWKKNVPSGHLEKKCTQWCLSCQMAASPLVSTKCCTSSPKAQGQGDVRYLNSFNEELSPRQGICVRQELKSIMQQMPSTLHFQQPTGITSVPQNIKHPAKRLRGESGEQLMPYYQSN